MTVLSISIRIILILLFIVSCDSDVDCVRTLNQIPEFGRQKKCKEAILADQEFLDYCDSNFATRKEAANYYISRAWDYFNERKLDTAMFRFNQAWLLDSTNADIYWGFGNLLGMNGEYRQSIPYFKRSIKLNPDNPIVYESISKSYGQLFVKGTVESNLDTAVKYLKKSISIRPDARTYGQLTNLYTYYLQKDSAKKYLQIADKLGTQSIHPDVRKILTTE